MKTPLEALAELVSRVEAEADDEEVSTAAFELESIVRTVDALPEDAVAAVLRLLGDDAFLSKAGSWQLVYALNAMWEQISTGVRARLFDALEQSFAKFADTTGPLIVAEIFAEKLGGVAALAVFERLAAHAGMPARALIPHGLEVLARSTARAGAVARLNVMATDPDEEVRDEVQLSLKNIRQSPPN